MSFLDARARFEDDFFAGLTEAVRESFKSFNDQLNQLNKAEREAGRSETSYASLIRPVRKTVKPVEPVGFSNKEDKMSLAEMRNAFKYLKDMRGDARLKEAVRIQREMTSINKSHLSRALGMDKSWFSNMLNNAKKKGLM